MSTVFAYKRYYVLGHSVTPGTNEIGLGDTITRVEPKSMEVLVHLLDHAGRVVTRNELQGAVWGDVIVGDDSLTNTIIKLRKAFGDDARDPRLIETIPKRGYRLIAPVTFEPEQSVPRRIRPGWLVGAVAAVFIAGMWIMWNRQTPVDAAAVIQDERVRVAVASFANLSGDPAQDYLAQGVEQSILVGLAGIRQIAALQAGENTTAEFLLEGSVQRLGDLIRIDTRLLETSSGIILATAQHERAFSDIMAMEAEIEANIVTALALEIDLANKTTQSRGLTDSIEAYDLFLRARAALLTRDQAGTDRARVFYERAIAQDPKFARAYGGLALVHAAEYRNGWVEDGTRALEQAMKMAETALSIQPDLPEQYWVIGYVQTQRRNLSAAEAVLNQALQLDPGYADAFALLGGVNTYAGQPDKTLPLLRKAMRLRPEAGYLYFLLLGRAYYFLNDCEQALINLTEAAERNPSNIETHLYLAACMVHQGEMEDAEWETQEIYGIDPDFTLSEFFETYPMIAGEQIEKLSADLKSAGVK